MYWVDVAERLHSAECKDSNDALWQSVLRFYRKDDHVFAEIDGITLNHEYNYQGDVSRLAITDLTEYCYKNLAFAVANN